MTKKKRSRITVVRPADEAPEIREQSAKIENTADAINRDGVRVGADGIKKAEGRMAKRSFDAARYNARNLAVIAKLRGKLHEKADSLKNMKISQFEEEVEDLLDDDDVRKIVKEAMEEGVVAPEDLEKAIKELRDLISTSVGEARSALEGRNAAMQELIDDVQKTLAR
jgi:TPP-dependent pyruvate/acetoin dehydrogenase alpha subunit